MSLRAIAKKVLSSELTIVAIVVFKRIRSSISRVKQSLLIGYIACYAYLI